MDYKCYFFEEENKCIITIKKPDPILSELESDKKSLVIDLNTKNVTNMYDFFVNNTLEAILNYKEEITLDLCDIEDKEFYQDEAFSKLIDLISQSVKECNESIMKCLE